MPKGSAASASGGTIVRATGLTAVNGRPYSGTLIAKSNMGSSEIEVKDGSFEARLLPSSIAGPYHISSRPSGHRWSGVIVPDGGTLDLGGRA